jgi:insertion element IS1 protein InsB
MVVFTLHCPSCDSTDVIRHGRTEVQKQRYRCHACGRTFVENPEPLGYSETIKREILAAYRERGSLRALTRIFGVSRTTVSQWLKGEAEALSSLEETLYPARADDVLELDELWSFVGSKRQVCWLWIALCRRTRQVIAYVLGDRSEASCRRLWQKIPEAYRRVICYSDFWTSYAAVLPAEQHRAAGKESGETDHVERWNCTLRQHLGR